MTTILLADDSAAVRRVAELAFRETGWDVRLMDSGDHALEVLPELGAAALVADVHMPGIDGYELCRRAQALSPGLPVLLLVGSYEAFDDEAFKTCGASAVLKKPFKSADLVEGVRELLGAAGAAVAEALEIGPLDALPDGPELVEISGNEDAEDGDFLDAVEADDSVVDERTGSPGDRLSDADVDRIARRVIELMAEQAVERVAWEVVPEVAEVMVRARLAELEGYVEKHASETARTATGLGPETGGSTAGGEPGGPAN